MAVADAPTPWGDGPLVRLRWPATPGRRRAMRDAWVQALRLLSPRLARQKLRMLPPPPLRVVSSQRLGARIGFETLRADYKFVVGLQRFGCYLPRCRARWPSARCRRGVGSARLRRVLVSPLAALRSPPGPTTTRSYAHNIAKRFCSIRCVCFDSAVAVA